MFREILITLAEEASKHASVSRGPLSSPRQNIVFTGNFIRILITIIVLWILGSGIIIFLRLFPYFNLAVLLANALLVLVSGSSLSILWKHPLLAPKALIYLAILIVVTSIALFFTGLFFFPNGVFLDQMYVLWSFLMLIPSSICLLIVVLAGRKGLFLANYAMLFSDEIEIIASQASNGQVEESAIEVVD